MAIFIRGMETSPSEYYQAFEDDKKWTEEHSFVPTEEERAEIFKELLEEDDE